MQRLGRFHEKVALCIKPGGWIGSDQAVCRAGRTWQEQPTAGTRFRGGLEHGRCRKCSIVHLGDVWWFIWGDGQ